MNELDLINIYFYIVFTEQVDLSKINVNTFEEFQLFSSWCKANNKKLSFFDLNEDGYHLIKTANTIEMIDTFLKKDYTYEREELKRIEESRYQILFLPSTNNDILKNELTDSNFINQYQSDDVSLYHLSTPIDVANFSLIGPYKHVINAIMSVDEWPGVLVFKGDDWSFIPVNTKEDIDNIFELIKHKQIFNLKHINHDDYIFHLSDLHLGNKKSDEALELLYESIDTMFSYCHTKRKIKFLISGDLMNSPNRKNMYLASSFMNNLKKKYNGDVTFVLGNHDVIVHGLNLLKRQKAKVIAYLLGENIKVFEDEKLIVIKIDSTSEGNLARGKVGTRKLQEIDEELDAIKNLEDYTLIVMLHHHIFQIVKDDFLKKKWNERFLLGKFMDSTKALVDAEELVGWLKKRNIKYVFHGHKHIPYVFNHDGINVFAGGSACGGGVKEQKSRYLNYNILKYDRHSGNFKYCIVIYEDLTKIERYRLKIHVLEEEAHENS